MRSVDHLLRLGDGRKESEGAEAELDVVVDRLGDSNHGDAQFPTGDFFRDLMRPALRAVASDAKQDINLFTLQEFDRPLRVLMPARGSQESSSLVMNALDSFDGKLDGRATFLTVQAQETITESPETC